MYLIQGASQILQDLQVRKHIAKKKYFPVRNSAQRQFVAMEVAVFFFHFAQGKLPVINGDDPCFGVHLRASDGLPGSHHMIGFRSFNTQICDDL